MTGAARSTFCLQISNTPGYGKQRERIGFSGPGTRVLKSERIFNQRIKKDIIDD